MAPSVRTAHQPRVALGWAVFFIGVIALAPGCVRRTIRITTEPPHALVFLNDREIGRSEVTTDFTFYGDYDVVIRKEGYETLKTHLDVKAPWYQLIPFDFFAEVLWPGHIHDAHHGHFVLTEATPSSPEELIERANETRDRAIELGG
jgi:hypothetical protein